MSLWYASVNYGLEKIISEILAAHGAKNVTVMDSALLYQSEREIPLGCVNNTFFVLSAFEGDSIQNAARRVCAKPIKKWPALSGNSFRVIVMDCGKLVAIPPSAMASLERHVSQHTKLSVNRAKPDIEVWLNRRSNRSIFFMVRTKKHPPFDKTLQKGELKPDLVEIMLYLSGEKGVLLDPFGGSGAIASAAAQNSAYTRIYTGDIDEERVAFQRERLREYPNCHVARWNALELPLDDHCVDCVVTDPPWGDYEKIRDDDFYDRFIREGARVLKPGGTLVFLSSLSQASAEALDKSGFRYRRQEIMIGGKSASIYIARQSG